MIVHPLSSPLAGSIAPASDKSITHRALFFGALNHGRTIIRNPSPAADCRSTLELLRTLGYVIEEGDRCWEIDGAARAPHAVALILDCGNSGTTARLAAGFLSGENGAFTLIGDGSLMRRPMLRVAAPLESLGAMISTTDGTLPITILTGRPLSGGDPDAPLNVASAQVHAALLLAMLRSERGGSLRRVRPMRDHTLRMARLFGADVASDSDAGLPVDHVRPASIDRDLELTVPGDISSAAFMIAAAMLVPGSAIRLSDVGLNPTRTALLDALAAMGGRLRWEIERDEYEPIGRIDVEYSPDLRGIALGEDGPISVAEMIDELPLLALIAARAHGATTVRGAAELRVKESDRIAATARVLRSLGLAIDEHEDGFTVEGPQRVTGGVMIDHHGDHRLCMLAAVAGLIAERSVEIAAPEIAAVSYPEFWSDLQRLAGGGLQGDPPGRNVP